MHTAHASGSDASSMIRLDRIVLLTTAALIGFACQPRESGSSPLHLPAVLVVAAGASDVHPETKPDGEIGVTYSIDEKFRPDALLERIRAAVPSPEWQPLPNDWLNPGLASSHERGWTEFRDATVTPPTEVHQWLAQWQDSHGNVVWYGLRYDSKAKDGAVDLSRPDNAHLNVTAVWVPAPVAKQMMLNAGSRGR